MFSEDKNNEFVIENVNNFINRYGDKHLNSVSSVDSTFIVRNIDEVGFEKVDVEVLIKNSNPDVDNEFKKKIGLLVSEFRSCFALNMSEIGLTNKASMVIKLKDDEPVFYRPYRISPSQQHRV